MPKPIYRMSSAGDCPRALSAERLGYPCETAPIWLETAAEEGKEHEQWIKRKLRAEGHDVYDEQLEITLDFPLFTLVGHIDGKTRDAGNRRLNNRLLEIKSMSQYEFDRWMKEKWTGFSSYAAQISCYMKGTGLPETMYLIKNRSSGYIDKAILAQPPADFEEIIAKLNQVEAAVSCKELFAAEFDPENIGCRRCFYKALCLPEQTVFTSVPEPLLLEACANWRKGTELEKEAEALIEKAKKVFWNQTETSGQKKWRANELFVSKIEVKESVTYSKANLLKVFTVEQLKPAAEIKLPYSYLRIQDLRSGNK